MDNFKNVFTFQISAQYVGHFTGIFNKTIVFNGK